MELKSKDKIVGLSERKWIVDNWQTILRELAYHKEHRAMESTPYKVIQKEINVDSE